MEKIYLNWSDIGILIEQLSFDIIKDEMTFDGIYGIPRGGLPIAVALSHNLNLPLLMHPTENSLVVDDISDTGKTLSDHKNKKIATLFNTPWTTTEPDYFASWKKDKNTWIVFPWEIKKEEKQMDERQTTIDEFDGSPQ